MKELMSIIIMLIFINPVFSCTSKKKKEKKKIDETFVNANLLSFRGAFKMEYLVKIVNR